MVIIWMYLSIVHDGSRRINVKLSFKDLKKRNKLENDPFFYFHICIAVSGKALKNFVISSGSEVQLNSSKMQ